MDFKATTVAPQGRNKYGNYMSSSNVTKAVAVTTYGGNAAGGGGAPTPEPLPDDSFVLFLSKTNETYDVSQFGGEAFEDTINITGYNNTYKAHTYVGDLSRVLEVDPVTGELIIPEIINNDIECSDPNVILTVNGNGTDNTSITMRFPDGYIPLSGGTLRIPVSIYMGKELNPEDGNYDSYGLWYSLKTDCVSMWFTFTWNITSNASTTEGYVIDLSNEMAEINADAEGNIYANSKRPDDCEIKLFKGIELMTAARCNVQAIGATASGWTYGYSEENGYTTIHFNQAGHANPFNFEGEAMSFRIEVSLDGVDVGTRFMKISKNKAGADGTSPITRWITTNPNEITIDVNTDPYTYSSTNIVATIWKQEGENTPIADNDTIGYWWYDGESIGNRTFRGSEDVPLNATISGVTFGLLKADGNRTIIKDYYELEDIPFIYSGKNGQEGDPGQPGDPGEPGEDGQSVYTLYLTNDSASVNCDKDGNVYASSKALLDCDATLYYGKDKVATESVTDIIWTVTTDAGTNIPFDISDNGATISLDFSQYTFPQEVKGIKVNITSEYSGETFSKIMSISKNYPGADGTSPTNYWLTIFPNVVTCTKAKTQTGVTYQPDATEITVTAKKQIGDGAILPLSVNEGKIFWDWHYRSGGIDSGGSDTSGSTTINITDEDCVKYGSINVYLKIGNETVDNQMIPILANGLDGEDGKQGRTGAAVRGPVEWIDDEMGNRVFCDGNEYTGDNQTIKDAHPELWIDIVLRRENDTDKYYRCIDSFQCDPTYTWNDVKDYFEEADAQYKFVATDLLLARDAKINFLTGNEIYMVGKDDSGKETVKAGMAGGDTINFWAGSDKPGEAPFQVNNAGEVTATKGTIGGWDITDTYLMHTEDTGDGHRTSYLGDDWIELSTSEGGINKSFKVRTQDATVCNIRSEQGPALVVNGDAVFGRDEGTIYLDGDVKRQNDDDAINFLSPISFDNNTPFKIEIVSEIPANPDPQTLYFKM